LYIFPIEIYTNMSKRILVLVEDFIFSCLYNANVHLIEIDLLRRGNRPFNHPRLPDVPYLITLTRAGSGVIDLWPVTLQDTLPTIPVPLREGDLDAVLELQAVLNAIYDEAGYDLSIDYTQPPPPPVLSDADIEWMYKRLGKSSL
jgi:hypothetical protein